MEQLIADVVLVIFKYCDRVSLLMIYYSRMFPSEFFEKFHLLDASELSTQAVKKGYFEIVKWAHKKGFHWNYQTTSTAARYGRLDILKYLRRYGCEWNEYTCSNAAANGNLDTLEWVRQQGCPWNSFVYSSAARNGHLNIIEYARENGCPLTYHIFQAATISGHLHILKWLYEKGEMFVISEHRDFVCIYHIAARKGYLHIIKWFHENIWQLDADEDDEFTLDCVSDIFSIAALHDNLHIVEWIHGEGWRLSGSAYLKICKMMAKSGNLIMLQWIHEHVFPLIKRDICQQIHDLAQQQSNKNIVEWIQKIGINIANY